jgi:hypothetical protein
VFHQEKDEVRTAGLETASVIGTDDTGARHRGRNGYCNVIGNELFACFESTDTKSRLTELAITSDRHVRMATEGALLGGLIERGVSPQLVVLSDGAPQFDILLHASCWVHAERPLARMVPHNDAHRAVIEEVRERIWQLYKDLKAYRLEPEEARRPILEARFDELCAGRTGFPSTSTWPLLGSTRAVVSASRPYRRLPSTPKRLTYHRPLPANSPTANATRCPPPKPPPNHLSN